MNPLDKLARALSVKASYPTGSDLFPQKRGSGFGPLGSMFETGPIAFPGWPDRVTDKAVSPAQKPYVSMTSPWFFGNVRAIAGESGVLELEVMQRKDGADVQAELEPVANHPLEKLWAKPNPFMGHTFVMQFWVWQMYLFGKAFLYFAPERIGGELKEMWPVPAARMKPVGVGDKFVDHYEYTVDANKVINIPAELVCYSRFINPFDALDGLSPLVAAFNGIETDLAMSKWNSNFFGPENAVPTAIATLSDSTSDSDFRQIRQDLLENFGRGKRKLLVTRGDDIDFRILQFNPEQMMFDKLREISRMEIDRACGLPDGFWTSRANRANSEHADSVIVNTIIWPLGVGLVEDLNAQIIPQHYGDDHLASFKDVRQRNIQQELEELKTLMSIYTVAELRQMRPAPEVTEVGWIGGVKDDPRNNLLIAQIAMGQGNPQAAAPAQEVPEGDTANVAEEDVEEEETKPEEVSDAVTLEEVAKALAQWQFKSVKRIKAGRTAACSFKHVAIPEPVALAIELRLTECVTKDDVRDVFRAIRVEDERVG